MKEKLLFSQYLDLLIVLLLSFLSILFVLIPPFNQTPLRIIFAFPILLFLPGYVLIATMFPCKTELTVIERFTLSIGLSIAIFVFDGFAVSVTPLLFRPVSIVSTLSMFTSLFTLLAFFRRIRTPIKDRYFVNLLSVTDFIDSLKVKGEQSDIEKALIIGLVGSIILASGMVIYAKLTYKEEEFSTLYILGESGMAEDYPSNLYILEKNPIIVGVENFENEPVNYTLNVRMGNHLLHQEQINLNHQEKWEEMIALTPKHVGQNMKLQFNLYKDVSRNPYRSVHLWVDSVINYDNLEIARQYALKDLPSINDSEMEVGSWKLIKNSNNFKGYYTKFRNVVENSTVSGFVMDNDTGKPVSDARMVLTNRYEYEKSVSTNDNGSYNFKVAPDHYWISCSARGYEDQETELDVSGDELELINFTLEQKKIEKLNRTIDELEKINQTIEKLTPEETQHTISVLKGHVINHQTGDPVANASIRVKHNLGFVQTTKTDENGYYEVKVISGTHRIEVRAEGYAMNITNYEIGSVHTFNLQMTPKTCKIKGHIFDGNKKAVSHASIIVKKDFSDYFRANLTGYYEINLTPGNYSLEARKSGYFSNSTQVNLSAYDEKVVDLILEEKPQPAIVEGQVNFDGTPIPNTEVFVKGRDYRGNPIEHSKATDSKGNFKFEVIPGNIYLDVLQDYMNENITFYVESGEKATFDIGLNSDPRTTYKILYPSQTGIREGSFGGIKQNVTSREGLATLSFKVKDSYESSRSSGVYKQVLINGNVIWEDSIAGDEGWEEVKIPVTFDQGENEIILRLYAKGDSQGPLIAEWDDVEVEPITEVLKEKTTRFSVVDASGKNYTKDMYLGKSKEYRVKVENNEQSEVNYTIQVKLGGVLHREENFVLSDGESYQKNIEVTPSILGNFLKIEFLLFKEGVEKPYKEVTMWASSKLSDEYNLEKYVVPLPELENHDMEKSSGWKYTENEVNFSGGYSSSTFVSPYNSYRITSGDCSKNCYAGIHQNFSVKEPANAVFSFNVKDSYTHSRDAGLFKQALLNGDVIWEDDVGGDEGWLHENIPHTILKHNNTLELRVYGKSSVPVDVWWDDVEIKPITEYKKGPTLFSVFDAQGGTNYPRTLYLGNPVQYQIKVENKEVDTINYRLEVKLAGASIKKESFVLESGEKLEKNVTVTPSIIGDSLKLEFILLKNGEKEPHRYFSSQVSSKIDYSDLETIKEYEISIPPPVDNGDMESSGGWRYDKNGYLSWEFSEERTQGKYSKRIYQEKALQPGKFVSLYQDVGTTQSGVVFIMFDVKDNYNGRNATGLVKQVLLNEEVLWEDDIAGTEGWQRERIPVYFTGENRLTLRVYAKQHVDYSDISIYWDDVKIRPITWVLD